MNALRSYSLFLSRPLLVFQVHWNHRFSYVLSLMLLLQRSPAIRQLLELPRQFMPRFAEVLRMTAPVGVLIGTSDSVTGATAVVPISPSANPAEAKVGESFTWVFRTTGEKAKSYSVEGLPPGISFSEVVTSGVSSISGTPTQAGDYQVRIVGWEKSRLRGNSTPAFTLTLSVTGSVPLEITRQPQGGVYDEGDAMSLSVGANGGNLTYQWRKDGAILSRGNSQGRDFQIEALTLEDAGLYTVEVSDGDRIVSSEAAEIIVRAGGTFAHWRSKHGIADPLGDLDRDGLTNLAEYALGTDPKVAGPTKAPMTKVAWLNGTPRLVVTFPLDAQAIDSVVQVETSADLSEPNWTTLRDGDLGSQVVQEGDHLTVSLPIEAASSFLRLTFSLR